MIRIELELLSPALVGSGGGFGAVIDQDVVFDDTGLPYIPGKRVKGCLRDAALEVRDMFECARIGANLPETEINKTFGIIGSGDSPALHFHDLTMEEYEPNRQWLRFLEQEPKYAPFITREAVLRNYTDIRQQTRIEDDGTAANHSLRTLRVLRKGLVFSGVVEIREENRELHRILQLAAMNWRRFGTHRNRGFGEVRCTLISTTGNLEPVEPWLEQICTD